MANRGGRLREVVMSSAMLKGSLRREDYFLISFLSILFNFLRVSGDLLILISFPATVSDFRPTKKKFRIKYNVYASFLRKFFPAAREPFFTFAGDAAARPIPLLLTQFPPERRASLPEGPP